MSFCIVLDEKDVISYAVRLVRRAKKEVVVTMDLKAEKNNPLPAKYHRALQIAIRRKVRVIRYGYGPERVFNKIKDQYNAIKMIYGGKLGAYQRMIIVDKSTGMFNLGEIFFYTEFKPLVLCLLQYTIRQ